VSLLTLSARAFTASGIGEIGLAVGSIGIGATLEGPFVQVVLFPAAGRVLLFVTSVADAAWTGAGRGAVASLACVCMVARSVLSERPMSDLRNQDCLTDVGVVEASLLLRLRSDCLRPRIREAEDLGRIGSTASAKYSWARACDEVGRFLGSHIKHQVTNWLSEVGHWGVCRMVSMA
jgi:hypothetical protein